MTEHEHGEIGEPDDDFIPDDPQPEKIIIEVPPMWEVVITSPQGQRWRGYFPQLHWETIRFGYEGAAKYLRDESGGN